jgi:uncharacterized membrane protein YeaQ/YmgE (transglycosylase-associated protein family)
MLEQLRATGLIGSVVGAVIVLAVFGAIRSRASR